VVDPGYHARTAMANRSHVDPPGADAEDTLALLTAARSGDDAALDRLFGRYVPSLQRWARGRLPGWARDLSDTHDLVQETVVQVFRKLDGFDYRGEGALLAYLRQSLMNRIRNEIRRARAQPASVALDSGLEAEGASPVEHAIGSQAAEQYEAALGRLRPEDRELIVARMELDMSYQQIAEACSKPSADAARMAVARALVRLSEEMGRP
jgi:RNA polymerase sigma factor (sigma-70 family)